MPVSAFAVFVGSRTFTGNDEAVVELLPSWPRLFAPQQRAVPSLRRAHVCDPPAEMLATPVSAFEVFAGSRTFTGTDDDVVELLPSWPLELRPQQRAVESVSTAHVCDPPAEMLAIPGSAFAVFAGFSTFTPAEEFVVELLPSWP